MPAVDATKFVSNTLMWNHGTVEKGYQDSGWVWQGKLYPCLYTNDPNGLDKKIGKRLLELGAT